MLDTLTQVETPEGIALRLRAAGVVPRALAWVIDFALRVAVIWMLSILMMFLGDAGMGIYLIVLFALFWLYPVLFEVLRDGQTIGKKAMGLRVIHANGTPVTWIASTVRNLLRTVDMLPFFYGFGVIAGLIDPRGRRLGDMVAGTLVVHVEKVALPIGAPDVPALPLSQALSLEEKSAIIAFAERAQQLTEERQRELADILPTLTDAHGALGVQRLLGIASTLLGRS